MWPVASYYIEALAHCGPYDVIRKLNGKQGPSQRGRAGKHTRYVCNSVQTHRHTCEKKHTLYIHRHTFTRTLKIIKNTHFSTECQDCDLMDIDTHQKHMLLIIHMPMLSAPDYTQ